MAAPACPREGTRLFKRPVRLMEVGAEGGQLFVVTTNTPPLAVPLELVAHGRELRLDRAIDGDIFANLYVPRGTYAFPRPGVAELPALLEPFHYGPESTQVRNQGVGGPAVNVMARGMGCGFGCSGGGGS